MKDLLDTLINNAITPSGSSIEVEELNVTENGTYTAEEGKAFNPVNVNIPTITRILTSTPSVIETSVGSFASLSASAASGIFYQNVSTPLVFDLYQKQEFRMIVKFMFDSYPATGSGTALLGVQGSRTYKYPSIEVDTSHRLSCGFASSSSYWNPWIALSTVLSTSVWYYAGVYWDSTNKKGVLFLYDSDGNLIESKSAGYNGWISVSSSLSYGFGGQFGYAHHMSTNTRFDLSETIIEVENQPIWGQFNDKTENMGIIFS